MTQKVSMVKLLVAILMILATPLLFFRSVGDNPLKVEKNATQSIAIVNEDAGTEVEGESLQFGGDVTSLLGDDSSYEWTVVGRSAGENGLETSKYDAVVYIPSDFSEKIMTYDEERPVKTNLNFKVQTQLNSVNKEKVLREIETASKKVNNKMSTLYWNYVSADMENVRDEFDQILEKEQTFQQTMLAFYKPSSKDLAGQIEQQQNMLLGLQESIKQADSRVPEQENTLESFQNRLTQFVEYVDQYREYQDNQKQLLAEVQSQSVQMIDESTQNAQPMYMKQKELFGKQGSQIDNGMEQLNAKMKDNQNAFAALKENRMAEVDRQVQDFYSFQNRVLDYYQQLQDTRKLDNLQGTILEWNNTISEGDGVIFDPPVKPEMPEESEGDNENENPGNPGNPDAPGEDNGENPGEGNGPGKPGDSAPLPPDLTPEIEKLNQISEELEEIKNVLASSEELTPEELERAVKELSPLGDQILGVKSSLEGKNTSLENPLQKEVDRLFSKVQDLMTKNNGLGDRIKELEEKVNGLTADKESLKKHIEELNKNNDILIEQLSMFSDNIMNMIGEINRKEETILGSPALSQERRDKLSGHFDPKREIKNYKLIDLVKYYAYLDQYEATLNGMLQENGVKKKVLDDEKVRNEVMGILSVTKGEEEMWEDMNDNRLLTTQDGLNTLQDSFTVFMAEYNETLNNNQKELTENLNAISQDAGNVLERIQQPEQTAPAPNNGASGTEVVGNQQQVVSQVKTIHSFLTNVQDNQSTIVSYTTDLQSNVANVQNDADKLNNKWATNVASTQMVRDDVFSILGNAFVDGQSNGYVYDFLTNPLKVSGDVPQEKKDSVIPPVVILFIILISSLMIGYTSYYFQRVPLWLQGVLFLLLNLIVGFLISLYGLDIYSLGESREVEWTVFTILLLLTGSGLVRMGFVTHRLLGWFISVAIVALFVTPLLALSTPNFSFKDPMSTVYLSIQYGADSQFGQAALIMGLILAALVVLQVLLGRNKGHGGDGKGDEAYEG
ncbi:ESX secretion system protein YueB [Rossellomorea marisflavi]|uniref:type VII secretion protein EsaA n=1 Tax=Rossellomorea marisflavi TaxID=189381 RepID=UPI0025CAA08A|nr:type VII secretion protein EsaA [Rossellomorea marisflavi]GLI82999.1 ESX secretion system protein YueB [Rossellomorea marisflavi]